MEIESKTETSRQWVGEQDCHCCFWHIVAYKSERDWPGTIYIGDLSTEYEVTMGSWFFSLKLRIVTAWKALRGKLWGHEIGLSNKEAQWFLRDLREAIEKINDETASDSSTQK